MNSFSFTPNAFAVSRKQREPLDSATRSKYAAFGSIRAICSACSLIFRSANRIALAISSSPDISSCPAMYPPFFRTEGRISEVTHRLNSFACGSLLERIRLYKPDSLMI